MALLEQMHLDGHDYTFQQLRHLSEKLGGLHGEGVFGFGDFLVAQRAAGANMSVDVAAGDAFVEMDTGTRNGLYFETNDAVVNVAIGAAHATLPRLDQVVLQCNDPAVTGALDVGELKVIAGTATSGATLDNRSGAAALGNDRIRLADVLVGVADTAITTAEIRDRRPWARGFNAKKLPAASAPTAGTTFTALEEITGEFSGRPVVVDFTGGFFVNTAGAFVELRIDVDDAAPPEVSAHDDAVRSQRLPSTSDIVVIPHTLMFSPAAGRHKISLKFRTTAGVATAEVKRRQLRVREVGAQDYAQ